MNIPQYRRNKLGKGIRGKYFKAYKDRKKKILLLLLTKLKVLFKNKRK